MALEKKQLNVRIPVELLDKIENSGVSKQELVIAALQLYFDKGSKQDDSNALAEMLVLRKELEALMGTLRAKESDIKHLENQIGFLQTEFGKLSRLNEQLLLTEGEPKKSWWKFWK